MTRAGGATAAGAPVVTSGAPVVVLRALGIGDLATGVPALRALRHAHPGHPLWLAAPGWTAPLATLTGAVDRLLPLDGVAGLPTAVPAGYWPAEARLRVNLHGRGPESHHLLDTAPGGQLLAFACPGARHTDGPAWRADEHEVHRWCRMLGWYGIHAEPDDLALLPPPQPAAVPGATVLHPGAKSPRRRWPVRRFAAVARALAAAGDRIVVTGGADEQPFAAELAHAAGGVELAGRTNLWELAALVADARLVISGDTGVAHLATGYGTPSVVLCGPVPPRHWGPPPDRPQHRALWRGPGGLARITPGEVLTAAARVRSA